MKKFKKMSLFFILVILAACSLTCTHEAEEDGYVRVIPPTPDPDAPEGQLVVIGNKVFNARTGKEFRLLGVNVWEYNLLSSNERFRFARSMEWVYQRWGGTIIRLPLEVEATEISYGGTKRPLGDFADYSDVAMKALVEVAVRNKKYVILDLHTYIMFTERDVNFWRKWAQDEYDKETNPYGFANNPYVLFGLLNEPHDVSWDTWRNGGYETPDGEYRYGYQQVIEMIRDLGAKNIVLAAGLDWGYDLRGVVGEAPGDRKKYALIDQGSRGDKSKTGYGIMYDSHIYPWKGMDEWFAGGAVPGKTMEYAYNDWTNKIGGARKIAPVLSGECGWQFSDTANILKDQWFFREQDFRNRFMEEEFAPERVVDGILKPAGAANHASWMPGLFRFFDDDKTFGSKMHYTAWCWSFAISPIVLRPTGRNFGNDPNNYGRWDADVAARLSLLNSGSRNASNPLTEEEIVFLYTPNHYSGEYFMKHMQAARDRGETIIDE